ncbi:class I SAM-dependent methyltransferase [Lysobacter sp. HA35]
MIKLNRSLAIRPQRLPPSAWLGHIPFGAWVMEELRPSLFVELGTHHGASYLAFCQAVSELGLRTRCYAVDTWQGDEHAAGYDDSVYDALQPYHESTYADFSKLLRMTFDEALDRFDDGTVDLLHIDGLHTYDAVKHDFESWRPKLSSRGVVLFHDLEERHRDFGVWRYWQEVSRDYPSFSFTHSHGLGVLLVGNDVPATLRELCELDDHGASVVSRLFSALGRGVQSMQDIAWWREEAERLGIRAAAAEAHIEELRDHIRQLEASISALAEAQRHAEDERAVADAAVLTHAQVREELRRQLDTVEARLAQAVVDAEQSASQHQRDTSALLERLTSIQSDADDRLRAASRQESDLKIELESCRELSRTVELHNRELLEKLGAGAQLLDEVRGREQRLQADCVDRDEVIAGLTRDLHGAREALNDQDVRIGRAVRRLRRRVAPDGTWRGQLATVVVRWLVARMRRPGLTSDLAPIPIPPLDGSLVRGAASPEYAAYITAVEPKKEALESQRRLSESMGYTPLISIIVPVYRLPQALLEQTLQSIEAQTYPNWQACIAWADQDDTEGWAWLARRCTDPRFRLLRLERNGGISRNSNEALAVAEGEFIALLDHDDTLAPWALFDMVQALQGTSDIDFLYSDKDCIDESGSTRLNPLFKPEWSPEMLHSVNYLTHFNLLRTTLVREVGGWDPDTDGAQDWDIFFKVTERARRVVRVPSIHYHWRILPSSTSTGLQSKPYAILGQLRTQKNHFMRRNLPATVRRTDAGLFHVTWPVRPASVDVLIVQDGTQDEAAYVVELVRASKLDSISKITVLHEGERGVALAALADGLPGRLQLLRQEQIDWQGVCASLTRDADAVILLSGRLLGLSGGIVDELAGWVANHPDIAWNGAIALDDSDRVIEAGRVAAPSGESAPLFAGAYVHEYGSFGGPSWYRNVRCVSAHAVAFRMSTFAQAFACGAFEASQLDEYVRQACLKSVEGSGMRGMVNPFAVAYMRQRPIHQRSEDAQKYWTDPYFSPAYSGINPMSLNS